MCRVAAVSFVGVSVITLHIDEKKKRRGVEGQLCTEYLPWSALFLPNLTECLVRRAGCQRGFFSLYLFFHSLSPSELRPGSSWAWLYCAEGKLPIRTTLIEQCRQEFYERADLLFITSLVLLLPHSFIFRWLTVPYSHFLPWSFPFLPLFYVHTFFFSPLISSQESLVASLRFFFLPPICLCKMAVSVSIQQIV